MSRAEVAAAYDRRAEEYVENLGSLGQVMSEDRERITSWRDRVDGRLLDAGCGPGHWCDALGAGGQREVVGLDASTRFLVSARQRFGNLALVRGDLAALPLATGSVGGVLAWFSLIHIEPEGVPAVLAELARVLVPGGSLLLGFFVGDPGTAFDHRVTTAYHWTAEALGDLLAPHGFAVVGAEVRQGPRERTLGDLTATWSR